MGPVTSVVTGSMLSITSPGAVWIHSASPEDQTVAYIIFKDFTFAAAHSISEHPGKCRHLHGHNYRVRVHLQAEELDELGMVTDFARLKEHVGEVAGRFDHRVLNDIPPFDELSPTAELLAEHIYRGVAERLGDGRVGVSRVEVWETETSCAIFEL